MLAIFLTLAASLTIQGNIEQNPTIISATTTNQDISPDANKGKIVFFRRARHTDSYLNGSCKINEQLKDSSSPIVAINGNRYATLLVEPGVHNYYSKREKIDNLTLEVEAGEVYFVECAMASGWLSSNPDLKPATEEIFKGYLPNLKPQK